MLRSISIFFLQLGLLTIAFGQSNIQLTNPVAENVLLNKYDPALYAPSSIIDHPDSLVEKITNSISADSIKNWLFKITSFQNRNTGSDTISENKGIGAAQRWAFSEFERFGSLNNNRLLVSYLQFDTVVCNMKRHRNVLGILPGTDTSDASIVIVEAHLDSRCEDRCDTSCVANGADDNGSGSALIIELARVMSKYSFKNTMVFMLTTGEEQGLWGAKAFAEYAQEKNIKIKSVLNNDIVGGVICGETASPPGCPGKGDIDSTQVRIYSFGSYLSDHKSLARYVKMQYNNRVLPAAQVPMTVSVMNGEDRIGRGGDHIPFRIKGYPAIRFTSANEHGHGNPSDTNYTDHQHTVNDVIGIDTGNDNLIDSFFVDFNYLKRNTQINAVGAALTANAPPPPDFQLYEVHGGLSFEITSGHDTDHYVVAVRNLVNLDFDSVYTIHDRKSDTLLWLEEFKFYTVTVASIDTNGLESCFAKEQRGRVIDGINDQVPLENGVELLQNHPNPFDETTTITVIAQPSLINKNAEVIIRDIQGKEIKRLPVSLSQKVNEVIFEHGFHMSGTFIYSLYLDGKLIQSKRMVFAN